MLAGPFLITAAIMGGPPAPPDAIYVNGNIYTLDPSRPRASAVVIEGGRIAAVGSDELRGLAGPNTKVIDLDGKTALPGLIDAHGHMASLGSLQLGVVDLTRTRSFDEVLAATAKKVADAAAGDWVIGRGWDHESWASRELPTHAELSAMAPDIPVLLRRVDGHAALVNRKAMELAGIAGGTPDPAGGEIIRDAKGNATGVLVDNAQDLVQRVIPESARGRAEDLLLAAQTLCLSAGLTGVHDAGVSPDVIETYRAMEADGRLKIRVYAMVSAAFARDWFDEHGLIVGERLTVRSAKLYIDGAMGSRGAWLLGPYADRPTGPDGKPYTGLAVTDPSAIQAAAAHAIEDGYQVCTHAIGDRGNREVLEAYERALRPAMRAAELAGTSVDHRFRIEHAQLLSLEDVPRIAALGIVASMQPTHCTSDMRWVEARVGPERARGAYAWATLRRHNVPIAGGSDFPVESHNPFLGLYAAVTRQNLDGEPEGGWMPGERLTREEALRAFTLDAAYAAFEERSKGSIEEGKLADFVVLDRDIMVCPAREIAGARVLATVIGGERVHRALPGGG